jgi:hypothetical protein
MAELIRAGIAVDSAQGVQNVSRAEQAFDKLDKTAQRTNASLSKSNQAFNALKNAVGLVIGIGTVTKFFHDLVSATSEGEQAQARLESVLKATGFAAGRTANQIDALSTSMASSTLFDDEAVKNMAGVLATFRNISGETFDQAIRLGADMAQVMGQDLQSSALQLGKALNDPILGVVALRRVGVQLNAHQKDLIQGFVKVNDLAGAQGVILNELAREFGGAAAAANTGLSGALRMAKKNYDNFLESLGRTQQVGGTIQGVFQAIADFWKSRELTTAPIEDMRIALDRAETQVEATRRAIADAETGTISWMGAAKRFNLFEGEWTVTQDQMKDRLLGLHAANESLVESYKHRIDTLVKGTKAEEDNAEAGSRRARAERAADAAASAAQDARNKADEQEKQHQQTLNEVVAGLELEARQLGLTAREARLLELSLAGASEEQLMMANSALEAVERFELEQDRLQEKQKEREKVEEEVRRRQEEEAKAFEVMWEQALRNTQDAFADAFESILTGGVKSTGELLKTLWRMWMRFLAQLAAHALFRFVFKLATGGIGFPVGGGTFGVDGGGIPADVGHEGGTVGSMGSKRTVSPVAFLGAPRYHSGGIAGLRGDEVPIIAQRGERIVPKSGGGRGVVQLVFPSGGVFDYGNPEQRRQFAKMLQQILELHEIDMEVT